MYDDDRTLEEDEIIEKLAETIHKNGLDVVAVMALEIGKPFSYIGGQMGRLFLTPFLPALGDSVNDLGNKMITILEEREMLDKLIKKLKQLEEAEKK